MTLQFKVNQPIEVVFDHLSDMQKFRSVHPVIHKIENQNSKDYLIHETLQFGFIPFSFTYPAKIKTNGKKNEVVMLATVMKMIKIELSFRLEKLDKKTTNIKETITFKSFLPVQFILKKTFREQHLLLFENINSLKEY